MAENQKVVSEVNEVSKITVAAMKCNPARAKAEQKEIPLARIMGIASAHKTKVDKNTGDSWEMILGAFEGWNLETGEVYQSGVLYLPGGFHEALIAAVDKKGEVEFALDLYARPAATPAGYSYLAKSIIEQSEVDRMKEVRGKLPALPKGVTAPKLLGTGEPETKGKK